MDTELSEMLTEKEAEVIRQSAIIETKLDTLIQEFKKWEGNFSDVDSRVTKLEDLKSYIFGAVGVLTFFMGSIIWGASQYTRSIVSEELDNLDFIDEVCNEVRKSNQFSYEERPLLCKK